MKNWWLDLDGGPKGYSQYGEEDVIRRIFAAIGTTNKYFVDIGAGDGKHLSNVRALVDAGWNGLMFDAAPFGGVFQAKASALNVNKLLSEHNVPAEFDLLSIDIDGQDWWVWDAIKATARVVVIEFNGTIPADISKTVPLDADFSWDGTDYYGASFAALKKLGERKGYSLIHQLCSTNLFFVRTALIPVAARNLQVTYAARQYHRHEMTNRPWMIV